jgi:hypothetical protein
VCTGPGLQTGGEIEPRITGITAACGRYDEIFAACFGTDKQHQ